MDANQVGRADLPPSAVALLELVVQGFQLRHGPSTIELTFQDGGFQFAYVKNRVRISDLPRYQESFDEAWKVATSG